MICAYINSIPECTVMSCTSSWPDIITNMWSRCFNCMLRNISSRSFWNESAQGLELKDVDTVLISEGFALSSTYYFLFYIAHQEGLKACYYSKK